MRKKDELERGCMARARDDEMTFVLLGRDAAAPVAIRAWAEERIRIGKNKADDPKIVEALRCADEMEADRLKAGESQAGPIGSPPSDPYPPAWDCHYVGRTVYAMLPGRSIPVPGFICNARMARIGKGLPPVRMIDFIGTATDIIVNVPFAGDLRIPDGEPIPDSLRPWWDWPTGAGF